MRLDLSKILLMGLSLATSAFGVISPTVVPVSFPKSNTVYVVGTSLREFRSLGAAKSNAVAGNTIVVGPGTYSANNLLKNGVHWYWFAGASNYYATTAGGGIADYGIYDDRAGAATCTIDGAGVFVCDNYTSEGLENIGTFHFENVDSAVSIRAHRIGYANHTGNANVGAIDVTNCNLVTVTCDEIFDPNLGQGSQAIGVRWIKGNTIVNCPRIVMDEGYAVLCKEISATSTAIYLTADYATIAAAAGRPTVLVEGVTDNYLCFLTIRHIKDLSTIGAYSQTGGGKVLLHADLIESVGYGLTVTGGWNTFHVATIKSSAWITAAGGNNQFFVKRYYHTAAGFHTQPGVVVTAGNNLFADGDASLTNAIPFKFQGSQTSRLKNMTIQTSNSTGTGNTNECVLVMTNGLTLQNVVLIAPNSSVDALKATNVANHVNLEGLCYVSTTTNSTCTITNGVYKQGGNPSRL